MALRLAGPDAEPLLRSRFVRGWVTVAIVTGGLLLAGLMLLVALIVSSPVLFGGGVLVGLCLLALGSVAEGGWHRGWLGAVERVAVALLAMACVAVALDGAVTAVGHLRELSTVGTAPSRSALPLAGTAFALLSLTVMSVVVPLGRSRRAWTVAIASATATLLGVTASAVAYVAPEDAGCSRFSFEPERWRATVAAGGERSSRMAEAIDRCDAIPVGTSQARVRALLGRPDDDGAGAWDWPVGDSDGWSWELLTVEFADGRVTRVYVTEAAD